MILKKQRQADSLSLQEIHAIEDVQAVLTPDLLEASYMRGWTPHRPRYWGHCYAASEALYHLLGGKKAGYIPMNVNINGESHWYLQRGKIVLDPAGEQFAVDVYAMSDYYANATCRGFLTAAPGKRAKEILRRVKILQKAIRRFPLRILTVNLRQKNSKLFHAMETLAAVAKFWPAKSRRFPEESYKHFREVVFG